MTERADLVVAYWRHHELAVGARAERLASGEYFWAWEAVDEAMQGEDPLGLLNALLDAPGADPCYLGAGPLEDLLTADPGRWDESLAEQCRRSERWRAALACVWLDNAERKQVPSLAQYLKPPG